MKPEDSAPVALRENGCGSEHNAPPCLSHGSVEERAGLEKFASLVTGFRGAKSLFTACSLNLFSHAEGGRTAGAIARLAGTDPCATEVLLDAVSSLGFLSKTGGRYDNTDFGRRFLLPQGDRSIHYNLAMQDHLSDLWSGLRTAVRDGHPKGKLDELIGKHPTFVDAYIRSMEDIARRPAFELAANLDLSDIRDGLDVGCGPGTYSRALLARSADLRMTLLDLEPTLRIARTFFSEDPGKGRVAFKASSYMEDCMGAECFDLVLLSHVTHNESEDVNRSLVEKAFRALRPGGTVVIHDFMTAEDHTSPLFSALFSVHMLVFTRGGRVYSDKEYSSWLEESGFGSLRTLDICPRADNPTRAVIAAKP